MSALSRLAVAPAVLALLACLGCGAEPPSTATMTPVPMFGDNPNAPAMQPGPAQTPDEAATPPDDALPSGSSNEGPPAVQAPPPAASDDNPDSPPEGEDSSPASEEPAAAPGEPVVPSPPTPEFPASAGKPTVYLAGDSTVQTYGAAQAPQQGWGQRIQEFFTDDVVFLNRSIGGRSSKSFIDEGRLDGIVADLQRGDYLFAQWGINDRYRSDPLRFTDPSTTFKQYLQLYIDAARSKDAIPVLVTPTPRLDFSNGAFQNGFAEYCAAIHELGAATNTIVIDLQTRGLAYYTSIGLAQVEASISLDVLHFKEEGAFQMARLVSEGVAESVLPIGLFVE